LPEVLDTSRGQLLGNILNDDVMAIVDSQRQREFGEAKFDHLPVECRDCDVLFACYGECPRNRFVPSPQGGPNQNYLCAGYKKFFHHVAPSMRIMASLLRQGRYADEIMEIARAEAVTPSDRTH
jgi:serine-type anaerobic sulfatase-maturating enzyme